MPRRLLIGVLGLRHGGKSTTWHTLFGRKVRSGRHRLTIRPGECVETYVVAGSPEERGRSVKDILKGQPCRIILCSMQYVAGVEETLDYFIENDFFLYVQWLSPAWGRYPVKTFDELGLGNKILATRSAFSIRSALREPRSRVREIREFIDGWARDRGLIFPC